MTKSLAVALSLCALLCATSCTRGPSRDKLQKMLQGRLDRSFGTGSLIVKKLRRRGHTPYQDGAGKELILVYYDATLDLGPKHKNGEWGAKAGSLLTVLGATPQGVKGIKTGNKAGDALTVHGVLAFVEKDGNWQLSSFLPKSSKRKGAGSVVQLPYREQLKKLTTLGAKLKKTTSGNKELARLTADLSALVATYKRRLGRAKGRLALATGPKTGSYYRLGAALVTAITRSGKKANAYATAGSAENCRLLSRGEVDLAFIQSDIAAMAYSGEGFFKGSPRRRLRALCALYPEAVQIVVRAKDRIKSLADLRGKRIEIGTRGSGARENALQVLAAVGLSRRDFRKVSEEGIDKAGAALAAGQVDALFVTAAFPHPQVRALAEKVALDLVPLDESSIAVARRRHPFLVPLTVPDTTYRGMRDDRRTVGVTALLVARDDAPAKRIRWVMKQLFGNVGELSRRSAQGYFISLSSAKNGVSIPWHPSAEVWLNNQSNAPGL
jgi:TRAP transporter TAXI family solute receptor